MKHQVISFANQKGGVGKTTTCINLAGALAETGTSILLVDMDYQSNLTLGVGLDLGPEDKSTGDVLLYPEVSFRETIHRSCIPNVDIAPASLSLSKVDINIDRRPERHRILHDKLYEVKDNYDYVFIDCPPAFNLLTVNSLSTSDGIIIPIQCYPYSLAGLNTLLEIIDDIRYAYNFDLEITGIVPAAYDSNTRLAADVLAELHTRYGGKVYDTIIKKSVKVAEGPVHRKPMVQYAKSHPVTQAYRELAKEFLKREG
ncbi:MAG: ParA family protein [Actinobacteria bacterium]|nr:ParA family protein [Actinomycetota bacterium]MBU1942769.1 ParA family protein [Actinomycetota bacterium]MBU2686091.1 ParA family protein [Actinomycetota bacterium]